MNHQIFLALCVVLPFASGCREAPDEPDASVKTTKHAVSAQSKSFGIYRLEYPSRSRQDISWRMEKLAELVAGTSVILTDEESLGTAKSKSNPQKIRASLIGHPNVLVSYDEQTDEFEVTDMDRAVDRSIENDIGEKNAREVAFETLAELSNAGILSADDYDASQIELSFLRQGEAPSGQPAKESVKEYRYFIPQVIDGVRVDNGGHRELGLRVSVDRTGQRAGVRASGIGVGRAEALARVGRSVTEAELSGRANRDFPSARVKSLGLRYSAQGGEAKPYQAYRVTPESIVDGRTIYSRESIVYYSVEDPTAVARIWPEPTTGDPGDVR